jgi:hypothetical protein
MNRFDIALGKLPPPPPEPGYYFMGVDKGTVRNTLYITVGHLERNSFVIDSMEAVSPAVQELNAYSTTTLLDFVKYTHKPMKARLSTPYKFIEKILFLHKIPYGIFPEHSSPEWRGWLRLQATQLSMPNGGFYHLGRPSKLEFQSSFELALALALNLTFKDMLLPPKREEKLETDFESPFFLDQF